MRVSESYPGAPDADGTWYRAQAYHLSQMSWADLQKAAGVYLPPEMKVIWYSLCIAEYDRRTLLRPAAPTAGLLTPASGPGTHNEDLLIASEP